MRARPSGAHGPQSKLRPGERQDPAQPKCYLGGFLEEVSDASPAHALWVCSLLGLWLPEILLSATLGGGSSDFKWVLGAACSLWVKRSCQRISAQR